MHNLGVDKLMMKYALELCAEKGCHKAVLSSNLKRDRAHAFYESLGFERHGYSYRIGTSKATRLADSAKVCPIEQVAPKALRPQQPSVFWKVIIE